MQCEAESTNPGNQLPLCISLQLCEGSPMNLAWKQSFKLCAKDPTCRSAGRLQPASVTCSQ